MDTVPRDVIECAILDGQMPQHLDGAEWCEQHDSCYRCAKDIHDMMVEEIRRLKAERDRALAELDKALGEREESDGWMRLPKDADGEPIRFGDEVEWRRTCSEDYSVTEHGTVDGVEIYQVNGEIIAHVTINRNGYNNRMPPSALRHHKQPTVEDVLTEFGIDWEHESNCEDRAALLAEYAAKLQLKEDA